MSTRLSFITVVSRHLLTLPVDAAVDTAKVKEKLLEHIVQNGWLNFCFSPRSYRNVPLFGAPPGALTYYGRCSCDGSPSGGQCEGAC